MQAKMTRDGQFIECSDAPARCAGGMASRSPIWGWRWPAAASASRQVYQRGYVLPEGALEQVPIGASQEQVLIVLGTPSTVATVSGEVFYYISQRGVQSAAFLPQKVTDQRVVAVYFDKNRRVERLANYGLKDGKVFDYVSRTTPTSGQELSYLGYLFGNMLQF